MITHHIFDQLYDYDEFGISNDSESEIKKLSVNHITMNFSLESYNDIFKNNPIQLWAVLYLRVTKKRIETWKANLKQENQGLKP